MTKLVSKILVIGILAIVAVGGFFAWQYFGVPKETEEILTGVIEGSLGYPSDFIPADMRVCAENIATKKEYCTDRHIKDKKYTYGEGYKIEVPAGSYYVFATLPKRGDYRAYYSEFVTCGLSVDCPSHKPITVTIKPGSVTTNIDPQDWYKNSANLETYRNTEYGFEITLPDSWKGYSIIAESWMGYILDSDPEQPQQLHGPEIFIRNPKWTQVQPWQDIPIMVFTKDEWKLVEAVKLAVSAAPIGPSKLGENEKYVFALPPRWVGFTDTLGQNEAVEITKTFIAISLKR